MISVIFLFALIAVTTIVAFGHGDHEEVSINSVLPAFRDRLHVYIRPLTVDTKLPYTPREAAILGQVVANLTENALTRTNIIHVLNEALIKQTLIKQKSDITQLFDMATMSNLANDIDVDLLVDGTITSIGKDAEGKIVSTTLKMTLYDAKVGKILNTFIVSGENVEDILAIGDTVDPAGHLWPYSRTGRATRMATEQIAEKILAVLPINGQVLTVTQDKSLLIDVGYTTGVVLGDIFECFRVNQKLNEKDEIINENRRLICALKVTKTLPNACICVPVVAGIELPQSDDIIVLQRK
jgi:hypothetical protein